MDALLKRTAHRPFPLPAKPWVGSMRWHDLLFAHWALDPEDVRAQMPAPLRPFLDTYHGKAWVGVIPFSMSGIRARWTQPLPGLSYSPELNVRTYCSVERKPGVYFFSLDLMNWPGVAIGRFGYALPYFYAKMKAQRNDASDTSVASTRISFHSSRVQPPHPAEYAVEYGAADDELFNAVPGSLEYFVTERYCLYTADKRAQIYRANIHHLPWLLQRARAEIQVNTMAAINGLRLPAESPHLLYAREMPVLVWWPEQVTSSVLQHT